MATENKEDLKLYDSNSAMKVVYCIYDNPNILSDDKYSFRESDFVKDFHRYVFIAINNLYQGGTQRPTIQDIHDYLERRPSWFFEYEVHGGDEWFEDAEKQVDTNSFDYYYGRLKKFSLLRGYKKAGFNTNLIYDPDAISPEKRQKQEESLDNTDLEGFVSNIEHRFEKVKEECIDSYNDESFQIGDDIEGTIEKIKNGESRGFRLYDTVLDSITRGARRGAFYIRSGSSGLGKCLPNSSLVPTPEGFRHVGDIHPGDQLFDAHGKPTNVLGIFPQGKLEVWQVAFDDGRTVKCSADHLWSFYTFDQWSMDKFDKKRNFTTATIKEIKENYGIHKKCSGVKNIFIPVASFEHDTRYGRFNPVVSIIDLGYQEEMTCFLVDNEEHLFLTDDYVVTHNTRAGLADALYMSCDRMWDDSSSSYVNIGQKIPTLFVSVELDKEELQTMALAFISGVDEDKILNDKLGFGGDRDRVEEAEKILKDSELKCEYIEDYSLKDVEMLCKRHIRDDHTVCIFWDYIASSMKLLSEISRAEGGGKVQEYQALNYLSSKLKEIAKTYNVFVFSSTQLNGNAKNDKYVDSNSISGSKAIINKCDFYMAMTNLYPEEKDEIEGIMYRTSTEPNVKVTISKNRRGKWNNIFLFMRADRGRLRFKTCFATDFDYNLIDIPIYGEEKKDV